MPPPPLFDLTSQVPPSPRRSIPPEGRGSIPPEPRRSIPPEAPPLFDKPRSPSLHDHGTMPAGSFGNASPKRSPSPMAIVGGSGSTLRLGRAEQQIAQAAHDALHAPPSADTSPQGSLAPLTPPEPSAVQPTTGTHGRMSRNKTAAKAAAIASQLNRPNTSPKSFAPGSAAPNTPVQYERAFRQWSVPPGQLEAEADAALGPATFQVYTPADIGAGRGPMRTIVPGMLEEKKPNIAARVGLAVAGGVVVLFTALAVIAVSTEEPHPAPPRSMLSVSSLPTLEPPPVPTATTMILGDPVDAPADPAPAAPPEPKPRKKASRAVSSAAAATGDGASAPAKKVSVPPPNPYAPTKL